MRHLQHTLQQPDISGENIDAPGPAAAPSMHVFLAVNTASCSTPSNVEASSVSALVETRAPSPNVADIPASHVRHSHPGSFAILTLYLGLAESASMPRQGMFEDPVHHIRQHSLRQM
jgi:hypothetical protein